MAWTEKKLNGIRSTMSISICLTYMIWYVYSYILCILNKTWYVCVCLIVLLWYVFCFFVFCLCVSISCYLSVRVFAIHSICCFCPNSPVPSVSLLLSLFFSYKNSRSATMHCMCVLQNSDDTNARTNKWHSPSYSMKPLASSIFIQTHACTRAWRLFWFWVCFESLSWALAVTLFAIWLPVLPFFFSYRTVNV